MTLGRKLALSFGAMTLLAAALGGIAWQAEARLGADLTEAVEVTAKKMDLVQAMAKRIHEMISANRATIAGYLDNDVQCARNNEKVASVAQARIREQIAEIRPLLKTEAGKAELRRVEDGIGSWVPVEKEHAELARQKEFAKAHALFHAKMTPLAQTFDAATTALVKQQREFLAQSAADARAAITTQRWILLGGILAALAAGALGGYIVRRSTRSLREISSRLGSAAGQVASAAGQVSTSSQALAQGASEQAASLEETSASSEEINSLTRRNADSSKEAAGVVARSQQKISETGAALGQMVKAMEEIGAASDKIARIMKVVDEIAFQTNILALNAAVEAARAGEAGMGFAVVADEVRNLAQRCAQAARDTAVLIEESITKSKEGKLRVDQVVGNIQAVVAESDSLRILVEQVKTGSEEQAHGIAQVARAVSEMEQVTQRTAATAEESAAAGQEMNAQAESLRHAVDELVALVGRNA
jgi:methyl-accepting chemotaxis protein/methyl-accepting chemotaxis protein-1 (serine sensor receptor)